jgi:dehydrogenase/reductase SDR family protein 4
MGSRLSLPSLLPKNGWLFRIGFAIAERLGHEGAKLVISSRGEENVNKAVERLVSGGLAQANVCG